MPRTSPTFSNHRALIISFFLIGFFLGLHYWKLMIGNECLPSNTNFPPKPILSKSSLFYNHFQYRTIKSCQNQTSKIFLTIAVLSSHDRLYEYLPAMFESWLLTTTIEIEVVIFLEENSSNTDELIRKTFFESNKNIQACVFIVKLKRVENEYPPQKKSFYAMKFLYTFYQHRTSWILRLDDNAYVNIPDLVKWLKSIDHQRALYIGQGGTGRKTESTIYFPPAKYFCMGGSGIILSRQTLIQLGPWLDQCFKSELRTNHEDVELGRCILTHVNIDCTSAYNSKYLFYHHYGPRYSFGYDFTPTIISHAFTLHPIRNRTIFHQLYNFYKRKQQQNSLFVLRKSSKKENYVTFSNAVEFDLVRDIHYQLLDVRWKSYINTSVQSYFDHLIKTWHKQSSNWTAVSGNFLFGYHRVIPGYGLELLVEVYVNVRTTSISPPRSTIIRKRFHIRQPLADKYHLEFREIANVTSNNEEHKLNLIVVSNNKDQALLRFIRNFENEVIFHPDQEQDFTLTILYFSQKNSNINLIKNSTVRYPSSIRLVIVNGSEYTYNRGLGRHLASKNFTDNQLLLFLDVDIRFTRQALINTHHLMIHQLSVSTCTVYFPIIFSFFSNKFMNNNRSKAIVHSDFGLFSIYGFGNVAVRKNDLDRIGGWETTNNYWGVEDINLFQRFVNISSDCYVFRAVEPGLRHFYHKKMCNGIKDEVRLKMCHDAEVTLLGSQAKMVDYIIDNKILNV